MTTNGWLKCTECGRSASDEDFTPSEACPGHDCGGVLQYFENEDDVADIAIDEGEPTEVSVGDLDVLEPSNLVDDSDVILDDLGGDRSESFEVDAESVMPGLAEGLSTEAMERVTKLTAEANSHRQRASLKRPQTSGPQIGPPSQSPPPTATYEEYDMEIDEDAAQKLLVRIYDELETARARFPNADVLILGIPQYKILEPWAQGRHNASLEDVLAEFETIHVVPGPQIHVAVPNHDLLFKHLDDEE